ncbi:minor tail protein [Mycobacterium phage JacoRen57]|nr:minor tail protein [Mycobacterium phage JacoRen57]
MSAGFYDGGKKPIADKDPTQEIQWEIARLAKGLGVDITQIIAWFVDAAKEALEELVKKVVDVLVGFVTDPDHMFEDLEGWVVNLPQIGERAVQLIKNMLTGKSDATDQDVVNWLLNLLNTSSPLNAANLFGNIAAELIRVVSIGALTNRSVNLIVNPNFTADAIAAGSEWSVDMSSSRTEDDDSGSGTVIANGQPHALNTGADKNIMFPVGPGQRLPIGIYVSHDGLVATGVAVILQIRRFNKDKVPIVGLVDIASYTPTVDDLPWPGQRVSGTYTVEEDVAFVQGRIYVTENALSGRLRFDDSDFMQANDFSVFPGLSDAFEAVNAQQRALQHAIANAVSSIPVIGDELEDLIQALQNFDPSKIAGALGNSLLKGDLFGIIRHMIAAARGVPVSQVSEEATLADLYNAMNAALNNVTGSDETTFVDTTTFIPVNATWTNYIDVIGVGRGQDGMDGPTVPPIPGVFGQGGHAARVVATTWIKGTHYNETLTGVQATFNSNGSVTFSIPGHSLTIPAASGPPRQFQIGGGWQGKGPGAYEYNGKSYAAGGTQNQPGGKGIAPGGSGAGGALLQDGGKGAPAGGWVRRRAAQVDNPSTGSDTTAPTLPTVTVTNVTNDTLYLMPSGSVDQ